MASKAGRGGVINALPGRLPAYSKDGGGVLGCPAQIAMPIWTAESASGTRKARGPRNDAQISGHRNQHEGDVITAPSREAGRAETAGGKLVRSEVLHSEGTAVA